MTDGLIADGPPEELDVFECPNCKETIDTSASVCRFCGAKVDHKAAQNAARILAKIDQACSDASVLKYTAVTAFCLAAGTLIGSLRGARLIERIGFQNALLGFCALVLILSSPFPIWSLNWWRKYASLTSDDEDFQNGRSTVRKIGSFALASAVASGSIFCLMLVFKVAHR